MIKLPIKSQYNQIIRLIDFNWIELRKKIIELISRRKYTEHSLERFVEYNIDIKNFGLAISEEFKIIEKYPNDPRGQSCLILSYVEETPIHAVVAPVEKELIIITVYIPSRDKWNEDFTRRKSV